MGIASQRYDNGSEQMQKSENRNNIIKSTSQIGLHKEQRPWRRSKNKSSHSVFLDPRKSLKSRDIKQQILDG